MKARAAIIGSGNIGTDLLYKALRSDWIEPVWVVGIDADSDGLKKAREAGMKTTHDGVAGLVPHVKDDNIQIIFDATSAKAHHINSQALQEVGVMMIDLTPAAIAASGNISGSNAAGSSVRAKAISSGGVQIDRA